MDIETASHPASTINTPHWWSPMSVKRMILALPSLLDDWGGGGGQTLGPFLTYFLHHTGPVKQNWACILTNGDIITHDPSQAATFVRNDDHSLTKVAASYRNVGKLLSILASVNKSLVMSVPSHSGLFKVLYTMCWGKMAAVHLPVCTISGIWGYHKVWMHHIITHCSLVS